MTNTDVERLLEIGYELACVDADNIRYMGESDESKQKKQSLESEKKSLKSKIELQVERGSQLEYIIENHVPSKDLIRFIGFLTGSDLHGKLFTDEEFKTHWYDMLRRLEKI